MSRHVPCSRVREVGARVMISDMDGPLPTLLSQALVAFTIEFDNEAERLIAHRTTTHGSAIRPGGGSLHAPWLVSLVMWSN